MHTLLSFSYCLLPNAYCLLPQKCLPHAVSKRVGASQAAV